MIRRPGITLVEVLVSIFIMGIGLLALLTLFPLGALTMNQAIQADRAAACARNAAGLVSALDIRKNSALFSPNDVFSDPDGGGNEWPTLADQHGPSYPVFVDPFGILGGAGQTLGAYTPNPQSPGIPRRTLVFGGSALTYQQALRWFSLLDDMDFDENGVPKNSALKQVQRSNRYTWALMMRRPRAMDTSWVEMAVVVYSGRPLQVIQPEPTYIGTNTDPIIFNPNSKEVTVAYTGEKPPVRKGGWILDATVTTLGPPGNRIAVPRGYFYRVVNVTDTTTASGTPAVVLELETAPRVGTNNAVLVVMEHVIEVFDEGLGWKP
ncbi:MAG TPA: prepilin-type N-terminal cleavage/methylation domain-containing protein [Gemmataceae bacterium]|nr:prepilin-type N-terminal cleavage/methylation domain-containing protein [Gemmataceae bacterium]